MARWLVWTLLTIFSWGIWAILFRFISDDVTPAETQVMSTVGIVPILFGLWLAKDSPIDGNRSWGIALALGSGILSCLGNIACYEALNHAKAATVIPLTALYPVVTVLLAIPLLKERLTAIQFVGIGISLAAIYFLNVPQGTERTQGLISGWMLLPLSAVVLWGLTGLMQKMATNHITARLAGFWFLAAFIPVAGAILLHDRLPSNVSPATWQLAIALGFALALGNYTLLLAFSSGGKAAIIVPLAGLYPLVSIPIAIVVFAERLSSREIAGILLALNAVVLLSLPPRAKKAAAKVQTKTSP